MKFILYSVILLIVLTGIIILLNYNKIIKNKFSKIGKKIVIDTRNIFNADKYDIENIYSFLEDKYGNDILLPKNISFYEKEDFFESNDLYFMRNETKTNIKLYFYPIKNNTFISKYSLFNKYGNFKLEENDDVPDITHLSTESTELNFNLSDIINSNYSSDEDDTDIDTTESILRNSTI